MNKMMKNNMRTNSNGGTQYRLQKGDEGYLFVQLTDSSLPDGEIQVFRYDFDDSMWRSNAVDDRWCSGIHPTIYARALWDTSVELGYTRNKSGMFVAVDGTVV